MTFGTSEDLTIFAEFGEGTRIMYNPALSGTVTRSTRITKILLKAADN